MIGRFARGMSNTPALMVAGFIPLALGVWFAAEPWRHSYPAPEELTAFEGEAFETIEVRKRRGAFIRYLEDDPIELQAVLNPGERIVLYSTSMPNYFELRDAITSGPAIYYLWEDAPEEIDTMTIWQLENENGVVVSAEEAVSTLKAVRSSAAWMPGGIALLGFIILALGLRSRLLARREDH
ncbi:MAG: hypothetical protein P8Q36_13950 [Alphaproteobacteria bacterium]|jgi:hypothetical protein|nr:hypothetical protein [Rhodospirillaceae bacterium]MDG2481950.1 hypothetical protein [Alphaproteobacteria bacterium]MBT5435730.1 hypothetical protein [Rhodospirillaceae bacterium]MBT6204732.1 hypothetical protein [Rhodospirillaceae bacterium]MBT6512944.1 hypothetical protein [Rhodospirillaceae bacterium]